MAGKYLYPYRRFPSDAKDYPPWLGLAGSDSQRSLPGRLFVKWTAGIVVDQTEAWIREATLLLGWNNFLSTRPRESVALDWDDTLRPGNTMRYIGPVTDRTKMILEWEDRWTLQDGYQMRWLVRLERDGDRFVEYFSNDWTYIFPFGRGRQQFPDLDSARWNASLQEFTWRFPSTQKLFETRFPPSYQFGRDWDYRLEDSSAVFVRPIDRCECLIFGSAMSGWPGFENVNTDF